ncbi:glycosyltransferase [Methylobacterium sp. Leaf466]|uniref:glycosyltransferase family 2 protein n=1 Tax=Methylobacterium sp. Leaf466 TaxID=1736386 RepID=UPI00138EC92A|nr:glycosyltransferase [Methylobacterium sp. Leaf466]
MTNTSDNHLRLDGHFEQIKTRVVHGWVFCPDLPDKTFLVEALVDGRVVASGQATTYRNDLAVFGIGDGSHGFSFALPADCFDDQPHSVQIREPVSGWTLPSTITLQVLPSRFSKNIIGAVSGIFEGSINGHAYMTTSLEEKTEVHLFVGGELIASRMTGLPIPPDTQDSAAPQSSGFSFDLADLPLGVIIGKELTITADHNKHTLGIVPTNAFKDLAFATFEPVSQGIQGKITLRIITMRATLFHVYADEVMIGRVEVKAGASAATFFIPYEPTHQMEETAVAVRLGNSEIDINGSPVRLRISNPKNLIANPNFANWTGPGPTGWSVLCEGAVTATYQFDDVQNASPHGPNALRVAVIPAVDATIAGVRISQTISIPLGSAGHALDVFVCARAEHRMTATVSLAFTNGSGATPSNQRLIIWPEWLTYVARLPIPRTPSDTIIEGTLTLQFDDDAPGWAAVSLIAAGMPGFSLDILSNAEIRRTFATEAVVNGDFSTWDQETLCLNTRGSRSVSLATPWAVRCKASNTAVAVRLTDVVTRDPSTADPGRTRYAVALRGSIPEHYLRLECVLDPLQLSTAIPNELRFFAQLASSQDPGYVPVLLGKSLIEEISILERNVVDGLSRDTRFTVLRKRIEVEARGRHIIFPIDPDTGQSLCNIGKRALHEEGKQIILVFEFRRAIDLAITEVKLGYMPRVTGRAASPSSYLSIEDSNIINQINLIKGIEDWDSSSIIRPSPNARALNRADRTPNWSWADGPGDLVDIIIPVHDAVDDALTCIRSLIEHTTVPHLVTIIDDASSESTRIQLRTMIEGLPWIRLIETTENIGYTKSANLGLAQTRAPWVVLLNSDTIVTPGWLEGLFEVVAGRLDIAMVGPVSNAASWQSVPELRDVNGRWRINTLPVGTSVNDMAALVARYSIREFPEASLLNGFCTLMRRSVVADVGYLDEAAFPMGYGEENDLCIRVIKAGHKLAVADHVYVHHVKSASFGTQRREILSKKGNEALANKHPDIDLAAIQIVMAELNPLTSLRKRLRSHFAQL